MSQPEQHQLQTHSEMSQPSQTYVVFNLSCDVKMWYSLSDETFSSWRPQRCCRVNTDTHSPFHTQHYCYTHTWNIPCACWCLLNTLSCPSSISSLPLPLTFSLINSLSPQSHAQITPQPDLHVCVCEEEEQQQSVYSWSEYTLIKSSMGTVCSETCRSWAAWHFSAVCTN